MMLKCIILMKYLCFIVFFLPILLACALLLRNALFLLTEFVLVSNTSVKAELCDYMSDEGHIPLTMHQIFGFKDSKMDPKHALKRQHWINVHREYTHYLWNETSVTDLVRSEYSELYSLFVSYSSWVQRADVGRYIVMYHYGGWYVDIDITCNEGIQEIADEAFINKKHVVLRETEPVGTSNDIFGITPRHPFLKSVLDHLRDSNRWYLIPHWNILLSAGSTYMWGRYINYPCKSDVIILPETRYSKYFQIDHDGSWHSWDTGTINVLFRFVRSRLFASYSLIGFCVVVLLYAVLQFHLFPRIQKRYTRR